MAPDASIDFFKDSPTASMLLSTTWVAIRFCLPPEFPLGGSPLCTVVSTSQTPSRIAHRTRNCFNSSPFVDCLHVGYFMKGFRLRQATALLRRARHSSRSIFSLLRWLAVNSLLPRRPNFENLRPARETKQRKATVRRNNSAMVGLSLSRALSTSPTYILLICFFNYCT